MHAWAIIQNPIQARVKVNRYAKNQGRRSNGLAMRVQTDRRTDRHTDRHTHRTDNITSSANAVDNQCHVSTHVQVIKAN